MSEKDGVITIETGNPDQIARLELLIEYLRRDLNRFSTATLEKEDRLDKRLGQIDERIGRIEQESTDSAKRIGKLEDWARDNGIRLALERVATLEDAIAKIESQWQGMAADVHELKEAVTKIDQDQVRWRTLAENVDGLKGRVETYTIAVALHRKSITELQSLCETFESQIRTIYEWQPVRMLANRVNEIERRP